MGAAFGLSMWPVAGFWSLAAIIPCAVLWAMGGSGIGRFWRFAGCPLLAFTFIIAAGNVFIQSVFACVLAGAWLTTGYGIPDPPSRPDPDPGSRIGRFFYGMFNGQEFPANVATRAVYAAVLSVPFFLLPGGGLVMPTMIVGQVLAVIYLEGQTEI